MESNTILDFDIVPEYIGPYVGKYVRVETKDHDLYFGVITGFDTDRFDITYLFGGMYKYATFVKDDVTNFKVYLNHYPANVKTVDTEQKMSSNRFGELLDELDGTSLQTLKEKNARYSQNGDALHNFRSGADIAGGTPAQACWGYMTKHLVALRDMVEKNDFSNREDFLEKCQDTINYIRFLWCIGNENKTETFFDE